MASKNMFSNNNNESDCGFFDAEVPHRPLQHSTSVGSYLYEEDCAPSRPIRDLEDEELDFWGRSFFLKKEQPYHSTFNEDTINREMLPAIKKSALKKASKTLNLSSSDSKQLIGLQTRERRRIYTKRYRDNQNVIIRQLSNDISCLGEEKQNLLGKRDDLRQEIAHYRTLLSLDNN